MRKLLSWVEERWVLVLSAAFLTPYLVLGFFSYPSADDYPYSLVAIAKGFAGTQEYYYNQWSGRYIATALMSLSPVVFHSLTGYKWIGLVSYLVFMSASWVFVRAVLGPKFKKSLAVMMYVFFSVLYLSEIPSVTEAFNWYPGVVNYTLSLVMLLLGVAYYFSSVGLSLSMTAEPNWDRHLVRDVLVLSVISFLMPGINESLVVVWLYLIAVLIFIRFLRNRTIVFSLLVPIVVGLLGFYIVFKAPGNLVRSAAFPNKHDIIFTLFRPLGLIVELFLRYTKPSVILGLLLVTPFLKELKVRVHQGLFSKRTRIATALIYLGTCFLFLAPAHWAMGGAPARRAMNLYCYMHLCFLTLMYCQWLWSQEQKTNRIYNVIIAKFPAKFHAVIFVLSLFVLSSHGVAWADLLFRAKTYDAEQTQRIEAMTTASAQGTDVVVAPLTYRPETLFFSDIAPDAEDGDNKAIAEYFGVKSVRVAPAPAQGRK